MESRSEELLSGYPSQEKAAYLGALASLATADRHADEQELEHFAEMGSAAGISEAETQTILEAAQDTSGDYLLRCLDRLKNSELRFSLVTDLIALAKADDNYSADEKTNIEKVSRYLGVNKDQFSVLDQFVDKAADKYSSEEEMPEQNLPHSVGMQSQFSGAGMNMSSMGSGLLRFLGPMILGGLAARTLGGRRSGSGGGLGGMFGNNSGSMRGSGGIGGLGGGLGGLAGGLGGLAGGLGGSRGGLGGLGGGLGSIISGMTRGRNNRSMGGMLGRLLK